MKETILSFAVGLFVGIAYGILRVKSPAPPIIALTGLLGMVLGEQAAVRFLVKKVPAATATVSSIAGEGASRSREESRTAQTPIESAPHPE